MNSQLCERFWRKPAEMGKSGETPFLVPVAELFADRYFDAEIVVWCMRWCLCFPWSCRDLVWMSSERGITLALATNLCWVQRYAPEFETRWKRRARPVGDLRWMDEAYGKVRGDWVYVYRAVNKAGKRAELLRSRHRGANAAKPVLRNATPGRRVPPKVTLDGTRRVSGAVASPRRQVVEQLDRAESIAGTSSGCDRCWGTSSLSRRPW
jgi:transposase-like protein